MKALIYLGPGKRTLAERPKPVIALPTDAVVKITKTTICGTDLHILKGDVPSVSPGRILGHEGVGIVDQVGSAVTSYKPGDRVLISCITACGKCERCREGMYSHCAQGSWILGNTIDGTQAEYARIPFADTSLYAIPEKAEDEPLVMLSDIFPTGYECGVLNGKVSPGDTVAIIGAGPIGLAALLTAQLYSPAEIIMIDPDENRLQIAKKLGATRTATAAGDEAVSEVLALSGGRGIDVAMEAVGVPSAFDICQSIVAPGGIITNIGVHGRSVELHLERLWSRNITLTTRLVDTVSTPLLMKSVFSGRLRPQELITHHFELSDMMKAYDSFAQAAANRTLKVIIDSGNR